MAKQDTENLSAKHAEKNSTKKSSTKKSKKKRRKMVKVLMLGILAVYVLGVMVVYTGGAFYYADRFFGGTKINGVSCSNKKVDEVKELLQKQAEEYELTLKFMDGHTETITGADLGMKYEDDGSVDELMEAQNQWKWIMSFTTGDTYTISDNITYKENVIDMLLWDMADFREENQIQPQDAYLNDCGTYYEIVPEVMGNALDAEKAKALAIAAVAEGKTELDLVEEECYTVPSVYQDDETLNSDLTQLNYFMGTNITYDFDDRQEVVDGTVVKDWLYKDEAGTWQVDTSKVETYVKGLKSKYDTFGRTREFVTTLGKTVTLSGGDYGWVIKTQATVDELVAAVQEAKTATMEPVYMYEGKCRATNDIGGTYIEVSIEDQRMWCYKDGKLVVDTPVVTGDMSKEGRATPTGGVWAIDAKVQNWILRGEDYETEVTFWLPFNGGVGVHDATWRSNFGGNIYLTNGSHGCINTPYENAEKVYNAVEIGHPVIVY